MFWVNAWVDSVLEKSNLNRLTKNLSRIQPWYRAFSMAFSKPFRHAYWKRNEAKAQLYITSWKLIGVQASHACLWNTWTILLPFYLLSGLVLNARRIGRLKSWICFNFLAKRQNREEINLGRLLVWSTVATLILLHPEASSDDKNLHLCALNMK